MSQSANDQMSQNPLRYPRPSPIEPAKVHPIPIVTIRELADAIYWIGQTAIRGQTETDIVKMRSDLALIEQQASAALSSDSL